MRRKALSQETLDLINQLYKEGCEIHWGIDISGEWRWRIEKAFCDELFDFTAKTLKSAEKQMRKFKYDS